MILNHCRGFLRDLRITLYISVPFLRLHVHGRILFVVLVINGAYFSKQR
jgi:hypothetical protein